LIAVGLGLLVLTMMACSICPLIPSGPSGPQGGGPARVTLVNNSGEEICYVYISPVESDEWGEDQLGATETVAPGARRVFDVEPGRYDLRAEDCDGNALDEEWDVAIFGPVTWTVP